MPTRLPVHLVLVTVLALSLACGGGGGGGGGGVLPSTGSVAVLVTDGPVSADQFSSILVTYTEITLIGGPGQVTIFRGRETVDLRDFEDAGKLVTVGRRVPKGKYEKIRMQVLDIELVPADGSPSIHPKLPPKLDLNPQGSFWVKGGKLLVIQIDFDAGKSIHVVETGNGGYRFRPVVFVDILGGTVIGKLVLLQGVIEGLDLLDESFLLCDTRHAVSRPNGGDRLTDFNRDYGDPKDTDDFCIEVIVLPTTSIFDKNGDPTTLKQLDNGDEASVLGRFMLADHEDLVFEAEVIQQGPPGTARIVDGEILTEVGADGRFLIEIDPGQGFVDGTQLIIQLQTGTKIFSRRGRELEVSDIQPGGPARNVGLLVLTGGIDLLKATVVVLDIDAMKHERVSGEIVYVTPDGAYLELDTDVGPVCVDVPIDARVHAVSMGVHDSMCEDIDRSDLRVGDQVDVFGMPGTCLQAKIVIAFFDDPI